MEQMKQQPEPGGNGGGAVKPGSRLEAGAARIWVATVSFPVVGWP